MFYSLRLALGLMSASTEATLVMAANRKYGARVGTYTLALLCVSSGCFNASTSMYVCCLLFLDFFFNAIYELNIVAIYKVHMQETLQIHMRF